MAFTLSVKSFQVPPTPGDLRLAAELSFGADLASDAGDFGREGIELIHHRIDGVLQFQDLAFDVDSDLLGKIALGDRGRHLGDVAHLTGQVAGHEVHAVREIRPRAANAFDLRLATELSFRSDLASDPGHLGRKRVQLVDHHVDGVLEFEDLAFDVDRDLLRQVAARDRGGHFGDVADLAGQVGRHGVDVVGQVGPGAGDAFDLRLAAKLSFRADLASDPGHLGRERVQLVDHHIDGVLQFQNLAFDIDGDLLGQIAPGDRGRHLCDIAHLASEIVCELIDVVGEVSPGSSDARHLCLAAELAFGPDLARDASHLGREAVQLIDHRIDSVLQFEDLAFDVDGDLL